MNKKKKKKDKKYLHSDGFLFGERGRIMERGFGGEKRIDEMINKGLNCVFHSNCSWIWIFRSFFFFYSFCSPNCNCKWRKVKDPSQSPYAWKGANLVWRAKYGKYFLLCTFTSTWQYMLCGTDHILRCRLATTLTRWGGERVGVSWSWVNGP